MKSWIPTLLRGADSRESRRVNSELVSELSNVLAAPSLSLIEHKRAENIREQTDIGARVDDLERQLAQVTNDLFEARFVQRAARRYGEELDAAHQQQIAAE